MSGLDSKKTLRVGKQSRSVPLEQVEMPDDLRYDFQQGPNTLPAAVKVCKREKHTDHVIGWSVIDDERDIASEAFVLRLLCKEGPSGIYNFVLFLQHCESGSETYRRIGMGMIYDQQHDSKWFEGTKQRRICVI